MQVYFADDLVERTSGYLVGKRIDDCYIIYDVVDDVPLLPPDIVVLGSINLGHGDVCFRNDFLNRFPYLPGKQSCFVVVFTPPNHRNFEYFAISPILLQLIGPETETPQYVSQLREWGSVGDKVTSLADERVLEAVNNTLATRKRIRNGTSMEKPVLVGRIRSVIHHGQRVGIALANSVCFTLVNSAFLHHIRLRLMQLINLPVHFGCYKGWLNPEQLRHHLPVFNSNVNVANSNYINFYNALWCVFNDIVLGRAFLAMARSWSLDEISHGVSYVNHLLFDEFSRYITWVAGHHPAGFKLNDELGKFMDDLFQWTLEWWRLMIRVVPHADAGVYLLIHLPVFAVLCNLGATFVIAAAVDVIKLLTLHFWVYANVSTKIYNRHLLVVKSLAQLYQGKKYNTLRVRVDHENFQTDQLLMGTLLSVVLILLLPTVLGFYLLFFVSLGLVAVLINLLEDIRTILVFFPLFPVLLKIKNSNRLQGGVTWTMVGTQGLTLIVRLSNKLLGWKKIFKHFPKLFNRWGWRGVISLFIRGKPLVKRDLQELERKYLMLPEEAVLF